MNHALNLIFPVNIGIIHFSGIGGIGMSGIAEILHAMGYLVQGSDVARSYVTDRLETLGIKMFFSQDASNVADCSLLVRSTAVRDDNPEVVMALELGIPVVKRSEMLAELMRFKHSIAVSGTHGKTTTTSLVACLLEAAGLDPTVINGGIINNKNTNAYIGTGPYLVAEADESDGTFNRVPSYVGVITNIDPEHLDYYYTFENVIAAYRTFINNLPFYGFGVLCYDHPIVRQLGSSIKERRVISYGIEVLAADLRAINIKTDINGTKFDVQLSDFYRRRSKRALPNVLEGVELRLNGRHNISNALAAIAVGLELGIAESLITGAFANFGGVKRRFTKTGEVDGITIIDDYAHHPVEIQATLSTAREVVNGSGGRVIAVLQPHRYTRLRDLLDEFSESVLDADVVIVADVYAAGESAIVGVDSLELIRRIKVNTDRDAEYLPDVKKLPELINQLAKPHDLVVFLGAGSITKWAYELPQSLEQIRRVAC